MLLLTAEHDHLVPPASTEGIRPHVGSPDVSSLGVAAGHVGLVVGGKAQRTLWPQATEWMAARSQPTQPTRATPPTRPSGPPRPRRSPQSVQQKKSTQSEGT